MTTSTQKGGPMGQRKLKPAPTVHFSVLGERTLCGKNIESNVHPSPSALPFTGDAAIITCERCKTLVNNESATGAAVWALEAEHYRLRGRGTCYIIPVPHVRQLFALAVKKQLAEVERQRNHLEYAEENLKKLVAQAKDAGTPEDLWKEG